MNTFPAIPPGTTVFVDTNTFVYHFINHPVYGAACTDLLERIERQDLTGVTSATVVAEMAHRLMTMEAVIRFGWPYQGIADRLRCHPAEVRQLSLYRQALDELPQIPIQIIPVTGPLVSLAADLSRQHGLLTNDALLVTVMHNQGLTHLASNDADFDRVPGILRYAPV
jgi:predicted nucleic acid-binding protein